MEPLGPWDRRKGARAVAVAVSGGADSMALALLVAEWGQPLALIVDHGLRPESGAEAELTAVRLRELNIPSRVLRLSIHKGPGLAARARDARYAALLSACAREGLADLLLAHHARDQAETVLMRQGAASGPAGLAGMGSIQAASQARLLRPLLGVPPGRLRATLRRVGVQWVEDPSNRDPRALRSRLRARLADEGGAGPEIQSLYAEAIRRGRDRAREEAGIAAVLAERASLYPEGFAWLSPGPVPASGLAALVQAVSGASYPPSPSRVARLARNPGPATLAGTRLLPAGRLGDGLLIVREAAAAAAPVPAVPGTVWDRRFRLPQDAAWPTGATIGALGQDASRFRRMSRLPSAVLETLPSVRLKERLLAVPHLGWTASADAQPGRVLYAPCRPAAGAPFLPAAHDTLTCSGGGCMAAQETLC